MLRYQATLYFKKRPTGERHCDGVDSKIKERYVILMC